jgi:hypothetical protein
MPKILNQGDIAQLAIATVIGFKKMLGLVHTPKLILKIDVVPKLVALHILSPLNPTPPGTSKGRPQGDL